MLIATLLANRSDKRQESGRIKAVGCWLESGRWVKPSWKSIITMKEALLWLTVFSFLGQTHFNGSATGTFMIMIIWLFKTSRRLDTAWNFARSITRVSTHEHEHWEHCLCTQSLLKRMFLNHSHKQLLVPLAAVLPVKKYWMQCNSIKQIKTEICSGRILMKVEYTKEIDRYSEKFQKINEQATLLKWCLEASKCEVEKRKRGRCLSKIILN